MVSHDTCDDCVMKADDSDGIHFVTRNPKRPRTAAWQRYEQYKVATTVGDALKLGAMRRDIRHDLKHGCASKIRGAAEATLRRSKMQGLRAQLQAERMVVSQLRDEVQRLAGHAESLQAQLQAERAAVSQIEERRTSTKKRRRSRSRRLRNSRRRTAVMGVWRTRRARPTPLSLVKRVRPCRVSGRGWAAQRHPCLGFLGGRPPST